jgi:hypothetical protein
VSAHGDDPAVHFIRDGRFVCIAEPTAKCRNYPACECEEWSAELHGTPPAEGHEDQPQNECWIGPWMSATDLVDNYAPVDGEAIDDDQFPDGPICVMWEDDYILWEYADNTTPLTEAAS